MKAAVLHQLGDTKVEIHDDVEPVPPGADQVKVRIRATGVCHSDLSVMDGTAPQPFPIVLGHEGAGEIVELGPGVSGLQEGDRVVVCWLPPCGQCRWCLHNQPNLCIAHTMYAFTTPTFRIGDTPVFGMQGTGTFAEELTLPANAVVKVGADVPFEVAALVGCGVTTGVGAAVNTAQVRPGSSVVVFGCGGVGISVIQGARVCGAAVIVAVDPVQQKLDWARDFGATHAVTPEQLPELSAQLTGGDGFDYAFEVVGRSTTIRAAYDSTRRGGTTVVVGVGRADDPVQFTPMELIFMEKRILGSLYGGSDVRRDYHRFIDLWRAGHLDLEGMVTRRIKLEDINDAFGAMTSGEVIRQVIEFA